MQHHSEQKAALVVLASCFLEAFVPVIASSGSRDFPPIFFLGVSSAIAAAVLGCYLGLKGELRTLPSRKNLLLCAAVALLIVVIPFSFIFVGARLTTSVNTAILQQAEIVAVFIIFGIFFHERYTPIQLLGATLILCGTLTILFRDSFTLNRGDLLILLATFVFPFGNFFAKRALKTLSPSQLVFYRYVIASIILLASSALFEDLSTSSFLNLHAVSVLLFYSIFIHLFSKILWYKGLRWIPVTRSTSLLSTTPAFSLLLVFLLLHEIPTLRQWTGFAFTMMGLWILIYGRKEPQSALSMVG